MSATTKANNEVWGLFESRTNSNAYMRLIKHSSKEDAQAMAKSWNKQRTAGEKSYYMIKYVARKLTKTQLDALKSVLTDGEREADNK